MNPPISAFYDALRENSIDGLEDLLLNGFDVNQEEEPGGIPLLNAARLAKPPLFKKLLEHGANLATKSSYNGETALHVACQEAKRANVRILLDAGADPNVRNNHGQTPLSVSLIHAEKKYIAIVKELLAHGADANEEGYESILMQAAGNALPECVRLLLEHGAKINDLRPGGTALTSALAYRQYRNAKLLITKGADPNICIPVDCPESKLAGKSALDLAILLENDEIVRMLKH